MKALGGSLEGAPSAVSCAPGRIDVVAVVRGQPKHKLVNWRLEGGTWRTSELPAGPDIPPEGLCAVSSAPNIVDVFAASSSGNTPWWWQWNGTMWLPRGPLPLGANLHPVPVAAVCSGPDSIDVFAAGWGNTPNWWHWDGMRWSNPVQLPAVANLHPVRVAAVSPRPNRLDVFAAGAGNLLWHWWRDAAISPAWNVASHGGNLTAEGVSAVSWGPNRIDVFAAARGAGSDNPLQHWWWAGGQFSPPENLGGNLASGTVSAVSRAPDRLDIFGISGDARLARWQWDGSRWSGPHDFGNNVPAGEVSAVVRAPNRIDVFVRGQDNSLRQWPGGGLENALPGTWENWPGNHGPLPVAGRCRPDSLEELVAVVKEAEQRGRRVRAVGTNWSTSDVGMPPRDEGYVVETDGLNRVLTEVLSASPGILNGRAAGLQLVHVEAGIKLQHLNRLLDDRNLAMKTLGGATGQSLAGALSTSVHGSDFDRGPLPDTIRAIHLVGPGGVQHWMEPSAAITERAGLSAALGIPEANIHYDDDWFNSVLVSMGSMGVIYSLIVEVVPQYDLEETCEHLTWDTMRARLRAHGGADDPFAGHRALQVVVSQFKQDDGTRPCFLTRRKEAPKSQPLGGGLPAGLYSMLAGLATVALNANADLYPTLVKGVLFQMLKQEKKRGWAHTVMSSPPPPPAQGLALEVAFDATNDAYLGFVDAALQLLDTEYQQRRLGWGGWMSLRFQGRSRAYLSPQHPFERTCTVEFAAATALSSTRPLLKLLEELGRAHGGIQHWGMFSDLRAGDVTRAHPRLGTWLQVRRQLTQNGALRTFDNAFTERCGLSAGPGPQWHWLNMGRPQGANIRVPLGAVTVRDTPTSPERPHVFVEGNDGNL